MLFIKGCIWAGLFYGGHLLIKKKITLPVINEKIILGSLVGIYTLLYFFYNLFRHDSFNSFAVDLSVYLQGLSHAALFAPILGKSLLADHFSPILYMLFPVFKFLSFPELLFLIQAILIAGAAVPLYRIARKFELAVWPALMMVFIYLNYIYTQNIVFSDFHVENFMPLLLFLLVDFYLSGFGRPYWVMLALCLTIKEDMGFYLFAIALAGGILKRGQRLPLLITAGVTLLVGIVSLMVLLPAHHGVYPYFSHWSQFGKGLFGIVGGAFSQPVVSLAVFFKAQFFQMIFSMALLPFFSGWGLIVLVPLWVQLASSHLPQANLELYYAAPILPFLFIAIIAGWRKVSQLFASSPDRNRILMGLGLFLVVFNFSWITPLRVTPEHKAIQQLLDKIPAKGKVLAQANIAPHIQKQNRVKVLGVNPFNQDLPHFVIFHMKGNIWPFSRTNYLRALDQMRMDTRYRTWKEESGILIFLKKPKDTPPADSK